MRVPELTLRLFHGFQPESLVEEGYRSFLIGRLLEEGDSVDLRWLSSFMPEEEWRRWLEVAGHRGLRVREKITSNSCS